MNIGEYVSHYDDMSGKQTIDDIAQVSSAKFIPSTKSTPNFQMTKSTVWTHFTLSPHGNAMLLEVGNRRLDKINLYYKREGQWHIQRGGDDSQTNIVKYCSRNILFDIPSMPEKVDFFLEVKSSSPLLFPLHLGTLQAIYNKDSVDNLFNGLYFGFLLIMVLYNLFIYFVVKDETYVLYIIYVFLFGISQAFVNGFTNIYFPTRLADFINDYPTLIPALMLFAVLLFTQRFLQTKTYAPKINRFFIILYLIFFANILFDLSRLTFIAYYIIQSGALLNTLFLLIVAIVVFKNGNKAARFYLLAWTCFLTGISLYVLREWGLLPANFITNNFMQIGSALEVTLLSLALADRINIYKKETEKAQQLALSTAVEKQELLHNQNITLEHKVEERTQAIRREKEKSDDLLLNILPLEIADELKDRGATTAKHFDEVTVLFTDFVNFTGAGERMGTQKLVEELHNCFKAFDEIISKYNIEKIKTIGDAYLAVSGLPVPEARHAENIMNAAMEIRAFMVQRKQQGNDTFEIRIGIHSGSVVAGIVGVKKFAYDIWGDTVNTAARMEQKSEPGKINISQSTYDLIKEKYICTYRGEIEAKNKGIMRMYFVEGKKA